MLSTADLVFDRHHLWHPYTSLTAPLPVYAVREARGTTLVLEDGRELIDGMSSWWAAIHGYNHPALNAAARGQLERMAHVMFGGITHAPAVELGKRLVAMTPAGLDRVFLADTGSVAVEVAMKMAVQYQHALGRPERTKFMTFERGYHGDTTSAMAVCDPVGGMHTLFNDFLPKHYFTPAPALGYDLPFDPAERERLARFFECHAARSAAFILEPIVQGAGGMRFYAPEYLRVVRELCDVHGLLLIADEIATGFGRTGTLFAVERAGIVPDIMCLGKAISGGYLTLAATLCTKAVAEGICGGAAGVFMHGPTFMGNPLACAVACASIDLLLEQDWQRRISELETGLKTGLAPARNLPAVRDVRVLGAIGVIELVEPVDVAAVQAQLTERGVWLRPFRNLLYTMPPYIMPPNEIALVCAAMVEVVSK